MVVWNEDVKEQPEEKNKETNKRGERNRDQERIDCGQYRSVLLRARKEPVIPESCHSSVDAEYP